MFKLARKINSTNDYDLKQEMVRQLLGAGDLLGLIQYKPEEWFSLGTEVSLSIEEIEKMISDRDLARSERDFIKADMIRENLLKFGIQIEDGTKGTRWRYEK